jgi:dihydroflavonol-4-reductase
VRFVPAFVATAGGAVFGASARLLWRDAPICPEAVRTLLHGHRYDGSRAARELGLTYTPFEDTIRRTLEWCAERGLVPPARV